MCKMVKKCEHAGCMSQPTFDNEGGKGRYCASHREAGMIDVKNKRCEHAGCMSQPYFDNEGGKGRYCAFPRFKNSTHQA
jgi:hypothetical protein